jgi:two-component system, OmpR family, response regulator
MTTTSRVARVTSVRHTSVREDETVVTEKALRVLVAEDDRALAALMKRVLSEDGYALDVVHCGEEARMLAFVNDYDAIVLDANLGDRHGFDIIQELRARGKNVPVLLYTGVGDADAVVRGLDAGADGYLVKPVSNLELRARVRSLIRRGPSSRMAEQVAVGELTLNRLTRNVMKGTSTIDLTPMELKLLEYMMLRAGQLGTRSELHDKVWDMTFDPSSNLIDAHIARLRKKLQLATDSLSLTTMRGRGFVLQASTAY